MLYHGAMGIKMVMMYRHDEDCNVAANDTLEDVVRRILKDE